METEQTPKNNNDIIVPDLKIDGLEEYIEIKTQFQDLVERMSKLRIKTTPIYNN